MIRKGRLFLIAGPSGVGKRTLMARLLANPQLNLSFSISYTTRKRRFNETDGVDYFFVTKEEFEEKIRHDEMLEYAFFFDNYYGTSKQFVEERLLKGKNVLLEIETIGFKQVVDRMPDLVSIFILPPSIDALRERLAVRGTESPELIEKRLIKAEQEIKDGEKFMYKVVNDKLNDCVQELEDILLSEILKDEAQN